MFWMAHGFNDLPPEKNDYTISRIRLSVSTASHTLELSGIAHVAPFRT